VLLGALGSAGMLSGAGAGAPGPAGVTEAVAPGLTQAEHTALVKSGAYGARPVRVLLLGDSITLTLGIGLAVKARQDYGLTISNHSTLGCDLDPTLSIVTSGQVGPATPGCRLWRALWPFLVAAVQPQVVALGVGRWENSDHYYDGQWVHVGEPVWDHHVESDLRDAISIFTEFGAKVVLFTMPFIDPSDRQPNGQPFPENTDTRTRAFNRLVEQVAQEDPTRVRVIGLNRMLGPHGVYTASVDGVIARWSDGIHITQAGGQILAHQIMPILDRVGLADERSTRRRPLKAGTS
jgi:hypothetical protein